MKQTVVTFLLISLGFLKFSWMEEGIPSTEIKTQLPPKQEAFEVLRNKCNVCHITKKKTDIFTLQNMDSLAADIQKQVFIKSKMPKGRKNNLTETETEHLRIWLDSTLTKK